MSISSNGTLPQNVLAPNGLLNKIIIINDFVLHENIPPPPQQLMGAKLKQVKIS